MIGPALSLVSDWSLVAIMPMNSTGMKGSFPVMRGDFFVLARALPRSAGGLVPRQRLATPRAGGRRRSSGLSPPGTGSRAGWTAQASMAKGQRAANTHALAADRSGPMPGSAVVRRSWWTESGRSCLTLGAEAISSAV